MRAMPSAIQEKRRAKFEHTMQPAVFLGYVVQLGCQWFKEYRYVFLDDLADVSFYRQVRWSQARVTMHSGREVVFESSKPIVYPCREPFGRDNETIVGVRLGKAVMERAAELGEDSGDEVASDDDLWLLVMTKLRMERT